ncbi:MAG: beta-lactamase-like protein [Ferruginibacter sp.]|nr:beta-lactamase-like protein [Ferruginibacter sp.]
MEEPLRQSDDNKFIPISSVSAGKGQEIWPDLYCYTNQIVNIVFVGNTTNEDWVLIDAGMPHSGPKILEEAAKRFTVTRPRAILLTHGHFDHVGGITKLLEEWDVPVFAHPLEVPYLTGERDYPEPDTSVEGGLLAKISSVYPHKSINISTALSPLPADGSVPFMPGWKWLHTPGHSPGHVSFFRESDKVLIAGDAFITVRADSLYKVLMQKEEVNGPPRYLTTDWQLAWESVKKLDALKPGIAITGHGTPMGGEELRQGLKKLVDEFDTLAIPSHGRFVGK